MKLILYYESCNTCTREYSNWKMCLCITYSILFIFFKAKWKEEIIKRNWFIRSLRMLETKVCRFITVKNCYKSICLYAPWYQYHSGILTNSWILISFFWCILLILQCFKEFYFWKGIWIRDIRFKCNLLLTQVNKILKNLETKKLIKAVKSVAVSVPWYNTSNFIICALVWSVHLYRFTGIIYL